LRTFAAHHTIFVQGRRRDPPGRFQCSCRIRKRLSVRGITGSVDRLPYSTGKVRGYCLILVRKRDASSFASNEMKSSQCSVGNSGGETHFRNYR